MNTSKKLLTGFLAVLLGTSLFVLAWVHVGQTTIRNRQTVKGWFAKSDFYNQIVDVVLEQAKQASSDKDTGKTTNDGLQSLPINDPAIQAITKQAFNPDFLKSNIENVLDSSYGWLEGSSEDLKFSVDLTDAKQQLASGLGTFVTNRAAALPVCTAGQVTGEFDGFNATCRPSFITPAQAGDQFKTTLLTEDFLKDPVLTADTIVTTSDGAKVPLASDPKATAIKSAYQQSGQLPIVLGVLTVLFALGMILIDPLRWRNLRRVGYVFNVIGVILLAIYIGLSAVLSNGREKLTLSGAGSPQQTKLLINFGQSVINDVKSALFPYVIAYICIGIVCYILSYLLKKRSNTQNATDISSVGETAQATVPEPIGEDSTDDKEVKKSNSSIE